ncbi:MAG: M50 family metallopeptidase [Elusimicrobiota bacterium]|mgnify:CR=1 FL=1
MLSALFIFLALGLVIFIHEGGHFIICRLTGIRVLTFAFGFGPEIVGFTRGTTRYSICAIPLGGYVKPAGEDPEEATAAGDEFFAKSWRARIAVALGGPAMNYVLAFVLFWGLLWLSGIPELTSSATIGTVVEGSPAHLAMLKPADTVETLRLAHEDAAAEVKSWDQLAGFIHAHPAEKIVLGVRRDGQSLAIEVTPKTDAAGKVGLIGIMPTVIYKSAGFFTAARLSAAQIWHWNKSTVTYLWDKISKGKKVDLAGPVGIVTMMNKAVKTGISDFLSLVAMISIAIGFFNLFPIPLLDGGHVVLYLWEGISRRRLTRNFLARANSIGLVILVPIFLFAFYSDFERIWAKKVKKTTEFEQFIKQ